MAIVTYQPVDLIPDYESLLEVWIALFSSPEVISVSSLCRQFWEADWRHSIARRAIVDVARSRFPVQYRPLIRLLRAMTGTGSSGFSADNDVADSGMVTESGQNEDSAVCSAFVFHYFRQLPTYTQVLTPSARTGANAPFDRIIDRSGSSSSSGTAYTNLRPIALPGGSVLPQRTIGRLMSSDSSTDSVVVAWQHEHNGWKIIVEVLTDYISRRHGTSRSRLKKGDQAPAVTSTTRKGDATVTLQLNDIGLETEEEEEVMVADSLELLHSVIRGRVGQTHPLMQSLELSGPPVSYTGSDPTPPDLVQLIFMVLEDALSRSQRSRAAPPVTLVTPALGVLSSLLTQTDYSNRVWLYLRSTSMLFGSDKESNFRSSVLATERACGQYTMTVAMLKLVRALFEESISSLLVTQAQQPRLLEIKDEVLTRAIKFVHAQVWVEHSGWRFAHLGERFQIGQHIMAIFSRVLTMSSTLKAANALTNLTEYVSRTLVEQATTSTINPIAQTIASGKSILVTLANMRRAGEGRQYVRLLESTLFVTRLILNEKRNSPIQVAQTMSVLEQSLCSDVSIGGMSIRPQVSRRNPVDVLAQYAREKELGTRIPLEAVLVLSALSASTSACMPPPPSIIGHFADSESVMKSFMHILIHPYDDLALRNAIWAFLTIAVEKQPPIAILFVSGQSGRKGKGKEKEDATEAVAGLALCSSVLEAACQIVANWKNLWEANPQLLASGTGFLDVVWRSSLDHSISLELAHMGKGFWDDLAGIAKEELGPAPDYLTSIQVDTDEGKHSDLHEAVSMHSYRTKAKSHALRIIAAHVSLKCRSIKPGAPLPTAPDSVKALESLYTAIEPFADVIAEACSSSFDPDLADRVTAFMQSSWSTLSLACLQSQAPEYEREFGDNFILSTPMLLDLINVDLSQSERFAEAETLHFQAYSINLNLSLAHTQMMLIDAWRELIECARPYMRNSPAARTAALSIAASISRDIASERRSGDAMCKVHNGRLRLLLSILEVGWFSPLDSAKETEEQVQGFMSLMDHLGAIITSEMFPPGKSFMRIVTNTFHRPLIQVTYLCARSCLRLSKDEAFVKAERRLVIGKTLTSALLLIIDALRLTFDAARTRIDVELDKDMELLVAVFQQCIHPSLYASSTNWLTRAQEADIIASSLQLLVHSDIAGFNDLALLRSHKRPIYSPHILQFHAALASLPFTAERLISENVVAAYSNNSLSPALTAGAVDPTVPELLPGERSTAHRAYCNMLANVSTAVAKLGSPIPTSVTLQVAGFVQLYGEQIGKALSWTNDEPLTLPFLDELTLTVELFYLLADGATTSMASKKDQGTDHALSPVLRVFTERALLLLQQVNYALTHPKHLTGLLEPITADERLKIEREVADTSVTSLSELLDPVKRPLLVRVVRRLYEIATTLLSTLNILSGAETVLLCDPEEWPTREALVIPVSNSVYDDKYVFFTDHPRFQHSKVTMGEPASIGTLLELGNCAYDTLRFLVHAPTPSAGSKDKDLSVVSDVGKARRTLETALVYAATQLMMWLSKHDCENAHGAEMDADEAPQNEGYGQGFGGYKADTSSATLSAKDLDRDRRLKRRSITLADRLRRGMTGEMTMDLQALIARARPVVSKSQDLLGKDSVDLTPILANFVDERVNS